MKRLLLVLALMSLDANGLASNRPTLILEHANVFTGASSPSLHDVTVTISGKYISSVGRSKQKEIPPSSTRQFDLQGAWILPGLIDAHIHLYDRDAAHRMLSSGVTTGRSMLTDNYEDVDLKDAYERGDVDLPRILAAGFPVVAHPTKFVPSLKAMFTLYPDLDDLQSRDRIGVDGAERVVVDNVKRHVDWIKVFANGRAGIPATEPTERDLSEAELTAAVHKATALGLPSAAHAYSDDGASAAVRAGVRTIEHGSLITEKTLQLMRDRGVCLVPTLSIIYAHTEVSADAPDTAKALVPRMQMMLKGGVNAVKIARRIGVPVIAGTDSLYDDGDPTVIDEIRHLVDAGMSPSEAIDAATSTSAKCLGMSKVTGAIAAGLSADIAVYSSNPIEDISVLAKPEMVLTRGNIYFDRLSKRQ